MVEYKKTELKRKKEKRKKMKERNEGRTYGRKEWKKKGRTYVRKERKKEKRDGRKEGRKKGRKKVERKKSSACCTMNNAYNNNLTSVVLLFQEVIFCARGPAELPPSLITGQVVSGAAPIALGVAVSLGTVPGVCSVLGQEGFLRLLSPKSRLIHVCRGCLFI